MDKNFQRQIAVDLSATGKEAGKRQLAALQALRGQVKNGGNIGSLIPSIEEVAKSNEVEQQIRREACTLLAESLSDAQFREKCSVFNELQSALWSCTSSLDENIAGVSLNALSNLSSEDFIDFIHGIGYDALSSRILDHRIPSVRARGIDYFGVAIVKAWAWVALLQDEGVRDLCVDMLRSIFSRIKDSNADRAIQSAIAHVLDNLLAAYLSVEPLAYAQLPLLHVAWRFGAVYATLLVELKRDLETMLEVLCEGADKMVTPRCIWLPADERGPVKEDLEILALEAATLRASILWILVDAGGLACRHPEGESSAGGSLIWELVRETCKLKVKTRIPIVNRLPKALEGLLEKTLAATLRQTNNWALRFCMCRATMMDAILGFASGTTDDAVEKLLHSAKSVFEIGGKSSNQFLVTFVAEICCSVMALWPMLECKQADPQILREFATSCAPIAALAASSCPSIGATPPRGIRCAGLAARAIVQVLARSEAAGEITDLQQVLPQLSSGQGEHTFVSLICRECANLPSPSLAVAVLRCCLAPTLRDAAKSKKAWAQAAAWRAISLVRKSGIAGGQNHAHSLAKILTSALSADVLASPQLLCMAVAALSDIGQVSSAGTARDKAVELSRSQGQDGSPELANYYKLFAEGVRAPSRTTHLSTFLCTTEAALQSAFLLHSSSDSLAIEAVRAELPENSKTLSGPPLMVSTQININWPRKKTSHVAIRVDIFNVTGVSFNNVKLELAVSANGQRGPEQAKPQIDQLWTYAQGRSRPVDHTLESLHARQSSVVWRDLYIHGMRPLCISFILSYDNTPPEVSSAPGEQTNSPTGTNADVWSEDEAEENDKLQFACHPLRLPLSVFFSPFYGFDSSGDCAFPPALLYSACPHAKTVGVSPSGTDLSSWRPAGFHRVIPHSDSVKIANIHSCYAGISFDEESILCLLCKQVADGKEQLEIRSSSQGLLTEFLSDLYYWILSDLD